MAEQKIYIVLNTIIKKHLLNLLLRLKKLISNPCSKELQEYGLALDKVFEINIFDHFYQSSKGKFAFPFFLT